MEIEISAHTPQGEILLKHLKIAGELYRLINITQYLVEQVKEKKKEDKIAKEYLRNYLMKNQEEVSPFTYLREVLEKSLTKEMGSDRGSFIDIYYHHKQKPLKYRFDTFTKYEWRLSSRESMTDEDILVMEKYKTLFISVMEKHTLAVKKNNKARKEMKKLIESFSL